MPRRVMFNGKVQEFPDDATDDEIAGALDAQSKPPALSEPKSVGGFARNAVTSAGNFVGGIGTAIMHPLDTATNLGDVAYGGVLKGMKAVGIPGELDENEKKQVGKFDSVVGNYRNRYGSLDKIGHTLYTDPVGAAADASMVLGGAGAALEAGGLSRAARIANTVSQASNPLVAPQKLASVASKIPAVKSGIDAAAVRMYQGALKPPPGSFSADEVNKMVNVGLDEKVPLGMFSGAKDKVAGKIDDINQQVSGRINAGAAAGDTVQPTKVANYASRSLNRFKDQVNPTSDLNSIRNATQEFLETQGQVTSANPRGVPIPVGEAQKIKQGTYAKLRDSYGELSSATKEAQKDLARGLKEEIYAQYPELRELGQKEGALINLDEALDRFAKRHGNRDMVGIGGPMKELAGAAAGHPGLGIAAAALEMPAVKSRLAIALRAASRNQKMAARGRQITNAVTRVLPPNQQ